jgi:fucose 4-O-acetylase-like acetyltransferase
LNSSVSHEPRSGDLAFVDLAKALGITLVVLGHYAPTDWHVGYWKETVHFLYRFHMPLFFFLSGFLLSPKLGAAPGFARSYGSHVGKKALRLLVPYSMISLVYAAMKLAGERFFSYNPLTLDALRDFFVYPPGGPADLGWFIYVLFLVMLVAPLLLRLPGGDLTALAAALLLLLAPWPELCCVDRAFRFLPIFLLGQLFRRRGLLELVDPRLGLPIAAALLGLAVWLTPRQFLYAPLPLALLEGTAGSLVVVFLSVLIERTLGRVRPLEWLGSRSFVIYLFHQPLAWAPAVVLYKLGFRGYDLLWGLASGVLLGLLLPAFAYDLIIRRSRFLSLVIVGERPAPRGA